MRPVAINLSPPHVRLAAQRRDIGWIMNLPAVQSGGLGAHEAESKIMIMRSNNGQVHLEEKRQRVHATSVKMRR